MDFEITPIIYFILMAVGVISSLVNIFLYDFDGSTFVLTVLLVGTCIPMFNVVASPFSIFLTIMIVMSKLRKKAGRYYW